MNKKDYFHSIVNHAKAAIFMLALIFTLAACPQVNLENPEEAMEKPSYTLSFNANGGSGSMNSITVKEGTIITLSSCPFTKSGMMFVAWNTSDDGFGTRYQNEASLIITKDITLFAQWAVPHTVTFNANGGTGTDYAQTVPENISTIIMENNFTKEGKILAYWNTESDGTGTTYLDARAATFDADVTLYAIWKTPCTVSFETNGGNILENQIVAEGNNASVPAAPKKDGYRFMGWFTDSELDSPFDFATPISEDTVLYASWKKILTLTYNANGGDGEIIEQTLLEGDEITLRENTFTRTDYGFACWNTSNDGSGDRYDDQETFIPTESMTLYAQWGKTCTLTFSKNSDDAEGSMEEISSPAGSSVSLPASLFTRTGYYVSGWNTSADGSGTAYANGQTLVLNESQILYAQWREGSGNFYPVNIPSVEHGTVTSNVESAMAGSIITLTVTPDQDYKVGSITITSGGQAVPYTEIEENKTYQFAMPESEVSVEIVLLLNARTISFDANYESAGGSTDEISASLGSDVTIPECGFTREDWTAISWNTEEDGSGTEYLPGNSITLNDNIILYAQWREGYVTTVEKLADTLTYIKSLGKTTAKVVITNATDTSLEGSFTGSGNSATEILGTVGSAIKAASTLNINLELDYNSSLTKIGTSAFAGCKNLKSIKFASNVTTIGDYAFCNCSGITSIDISKITEIDSYAFAKTGLISITIPAAITSFGTRAFYSSSLRTVTFASGSKLKYTGSSAFEDSDLSNISLPEGLKDINDNAFNGCQNLTTLIIPSTVENIGSYAFAYSGLTTIKIPSTVRWVKNAVCYGCKSLTTASVEITEANYSGNDIKQEAFYDCTNLKSVSFACSVPAYACIGCTNLTSVTFTRNDINSIGDWAFYGTKISSVSLPSQLQTIGDHAFDDCSNLSSVTFGNTSSSANLQEIGSSAFSGSKISSVTIPASVFKIGDNAFSSATSITFSPSTTTWYTTAIRSYYNNRNTSSSTMIDGFAGKSATEKATLMNSTYKGNYFFGK